jgi:hypothetical protein
MKHKIKDHTLDWIIDYEYKDHYRVRGNWYLDEDLINAGYEKLGFCFIKFVKDHGDLSEQLYEQIKEMINRI